MHIWMGFGFLLCHFIAINDLRFICVEEPFNVFREFDFADVLEEKLEGIDLVFGDTNDFGDDFGF